MSVDYAPQRCSKYSVQLGNSVSFWSGIYRIHLEALQGRIRMEDVKRSTKKGYNVVRFTEVTLCDDIPDMCDAK
jgi:hypothetical protein